MSGFMLSLALPFFSAVCIRLRLCGAAFRLSHILGAALVLGTVGCSMISSTVSGWIYGDPPRTSLRQITVRADIAANESSATMLDIVFVYDEASMAQLPKTGPEWFAKKDALQKSLVTSIEVVALQVPAASADFQVSLPSRASKAIGVFVLANYLAADGQPIANLTPWRQATIHLLPRTITFSGK